MSGLERSTSTTKLTCNTTELHYFHCTTEELAFTVFKTTNASICIYVATQLSRIKWDFSFSR